MMLNPQLTKKQSAFKQIEASIVRCPDSQASDEMIELIHKARKSGDSVGGIIAQLFEMCLQD